MAYQSVQIAKEFIEIAHKEGKVLTPMQLIKLVYLAHAWMLALYGKPLIEENVEAWKYGPVIPELYRDIKHYRDKPVTEIPCERAQLDEKALKIIIQTYNQYGCLNGIQLSMLTHEKGSPWYNAWDSGKTIISNDVITNYYQELAAYERK